MIFRPFGAKKIKKIGYGKWPSLTPTPLPPSMEFSIIFFWTLPLVMSDISNFSNSCFESPNPERDLQNIIFGSIQIKLQICKIYFRAHLTRRKIIMAYNYPQQNQLRLCRYWARNLWKNLILLNWRYFWRKLKQKEKTFILWFKSKKMKLIIFTKLKPSTLSLNHIKIYYH